MLPTNDPQNELQHHVIDLMTNIFSRVIEERKRHYAQQPKPNKTYQGSSRHMP
ncbi:hypothetical protein [Chloroflexus sp.]|uniref:hypothetical protein n=1 Tax=Chloroflexus sp. TaxID=1904827 RepID=UPI003C73A9BA